MENIYQVYEARCQKDRIERKEREEGKLKDNKMTKQVHKQHTIDNHD